MGEGGCGHEKPMKKEVVRRPTFHTKQNPTGKKYTRQVHRNDRTIENMSWNTET